MNELNIITMLLYAQRDDYTIIKNTQKITDALNVIVDLEHKLFEAIENQPQIIDLYNKLDEAIGEYYSAVEANIYYFGFKSGFKMALELGLCKLQ